jgi:hypothetical protein
LKEPHAGSVANFCLAEQGNVSGPHDLGPWVDYYFSYCAEGGPDLEAAGLQRKSRDLADETGVWGRAAVDPAHDAVT